MSSLEYLVVAVAALAALIPLKKYQSMRDRSIYLGFAVALLINLYFYLQLGNPVGIERFRAWHVLITLVFPTYSLLPIVLIVVLIKGALRGGMSLTQWDQEEAKNLLARSHSKTRRALARIFLVANPSMLFLIGWALTGYLIARFVFNNH